MIRSLLILAALLVTPAQSQDTQYRDKSLSEAERADCLRKGGKVERGGMLQNERCTMRRPDAGKQCRGKSDCTGWCVLDLNHPPKSMKVGTRARGRCEFDDNPFGCRTLVHNGRVSSQFCAD